MALGKTKLEGLVEAAFSEIEAETPDDAVIGVATLVIEVRMSDPDATAIYTFCTDKRVWVQRALLDEAANTVGLGVME